MNVLRAVCLCGLALPLSSAASAQTQADYPVCMVSALAIGEVPDHPFYAQLEENIITIAADGSKQTVPNRDVLPGSVARDSKGRVVIRTQGKITYSQDSRSGETMGISATICDPATNTTTRFNYSDVFHKATNPTTGETFYFPAGVGGMGSASPQTGPRTTVFNAYHRTVKGRENLGPETFEGQPAFRYRYPLSQKEKLEHEIVNSDDLFAQLAQITWVQYPTTEDEKKLAHIRLGDPPASIFDIPQGVIVQNVPRPATTRLAP